MKTRLLLFALSIILSGSSTLFSQGFQPPAEGKAVVYFVRVSGYGFAVTFQYFHQDKYIGEFKGTNYMRYECEPGNQLLWASSENKEFVTAELEAGNSYIVIVDVIMGAWKARVGMTPISINDKETFDRAKSLILEKPPVVTPEKRINDLNDRLSDFMKEQLDMYEKEWKQEKNFKHISPDMAIPDDSMK